jgi:hypothetical protein
MASSFDPTHKFSTSPDGGGNPSSYTWIGGLLVGMFLVMFLRTIVPALQWLFGDHLGYPIWPELLSAHIYWLSPFLVLLAGIALLTRNPSGYVLAMASCIFWLGTSVAFLLIYAVQLPGFILEILLGTLGLQFDHILGSLATIFLNVTTIVVLVSLNKMSVRQALPVRPGMAGTGIGLGMGMVVYAIICHFLAAALRPDPFGYYGF